MVRAKRMSKDKITIKAQKGFLNPKKTMLHAPLSSNWNPKWYSAVFTQRWCSPLAHTSPAAIPIKIYKIVQTGAKIQFGGLKLGFSKVRYQSFTELCVAKLDKKPMVRQTQTAILICISFLFNSVGYSPKIAIYFNCPCWKKAKNYLCTKQDVRVRKRLCSSRLYGPKWKGKGNMESA